MVLVVKAQFEYTATDPNHLSFRPNDLIQVMTQHPSGWWDGFLGTRRGWFPSNYVVPVNLRSRAEADAWVHREASSGRKSYWVNDLTGEATWEHPTTEENLIVLPDGWCVQETEDGSSAFFVHEPTGTEHAVLPPQVWEQLAAAATVQRTGLTPTLHAADLGASSSEGDAASRYQSTSDAASSARRRSSDADTLPGTLHRIRHSASTADDEEDAPVTVAPIRLPTDDDDADNDSAARAAEADSSTAPSSPAAVPPPRRGSLSYTLQSGSSPRRSTSTGSDDEPTRPGSMATVHEEDDAPQEVPVPNVGAERQMQAWSLLTQDIFAAIQVLLRAAKSNSKEAYIPTLKQIVDSTRNLLTAAGAVDKECVTIKDNVTVRNQQRTLLTVLRKIALSAKVASGVWPPPDAVTKMVSDASELLVAVRGFVEACRECKVEVQTDIIEKKGAASREGSPVVRPTTPAPTAPPTPAPAAAETAPVPTEPVRLTAQSIRTLEQHSRALLDTLAQMHVEVQAVRATAMLPLAQQLLKQATPFMHFLDQVHMDDPANSPLVHEYMVQKKALYPPIRALIMDTQAALQSSAPTTQAIQQLDASIGVVEQAVKNLMAAVQQVLDSRIRREHRRSSFFLGTTPTRPTFEHRPMPLNTELANAVAGPFPARAASVTPGSSGPRTASSTRSMNLQRGTVTSFGTTSPPATPYSSNKLRKFFGDDVAATNLPSPGLPPVPARADTPWYLDVSYGPHDLIFNMDGHVKAGTVPALIERLTLPTGAFDATYVAAFLCTYRTFMSSRDLVRALADRFSIHPPDSLDEPELDLWVEKKMQPVRLRETAAPAVARHAKSGTPKLAGAPSPVLPRGSWSSVRLTDLDPIEVARQLTLLEFTAFSRIIYTELLNKAWSVKTPANATPEMLAQAVADAQSHAPNLRGFIEISTRITGWVASTIVGEEDTKKRAALIKYFVQVADRCRSMHNYNTTFAIVAALQSAPVFRLQRTWEAVSAKPKAVLASLRALVDPARNFAAYRDAVRSVPAHAPSLPFLGRALSDLTFLEDGNPSTIQAPGKADVELVNFTKRARTAEILRDLQQCQVTPYVLRVVPELHDWLLARLATAPVPEDAVQLGGGVADPLYEMSLLREPRREREDQKLVRLLAESGLL
ncbi:hypothetical protein AMAG_11476 [Allomyces macrogynus ATCC 38327]|uniref:Ras GEF n=1 Tax=Allomyces macrogynus (strain ATCC 38327) TaxID=578462 RepID=A0A0L0SX88_ALLM3|nr:hypothetical protein AMAG_11476 [Allomyces macrogynus ATCC 38327]|eukprot:KNE67010.1 hypothetical protein AMAG_11476 [Allomyces macrogynus ATCC 38327]